MWHFVFFDVVRHRIDGLETPFDIDTLALKVRHRIDGLEKQIQCQKLNN